METQNLKQPNGAITISNTHFFNKAMILIRLNYLRITKMLSDYDQAGFKKIKNASVKPQNLTYQSRALGRYLSEIA